MSNPKTTTTLAQAMCALQQVAAEARDALLTIRGETRNYQRILDRERDQLGPCDAGGDRERIIDIYSQVLQEVELTADCHAELHWANSIESREHLVRDAERHVLSYLSNLSRWRERDEMQQAIDKDKVEQEADNPYQNRYTENC